MMNVSAPWHQYPACVNTAKTYECIKKYHNVKLQLQLQLQHWSLSWDRMLLGSSTRTWESTWSSSGWSGTPEEAVRLSLWLAANRTLLWCRAGRWTDCYRSQTIMTTLCTTTNSAPLPRGSMQEIFHTTLIFNHHFICCNKRISQIWENLFVAGSAIR